MSLNLKIIEQKNLGCLDGRLGLPIAEQDRHFQSFFPKAVTYAFKRIRSFAWRTGANLAVISNENLSSDMRDYSVNIKYYRTTLV